eukprot:6187272-Pleurochrysis_carterae.AAC.1
MVAAGTRHRQHDAAFLRCTRMAAAPGEACLSSLAAQQRQDGRAVDTSMTPAHALELHRNTCQGWRSLGRMLWTERSHSREDSAVCGLMREQMLRRNALRRAIVPAALAQVQLYSHGVRAESAALLHSAETAATMDQ